MNPEPRFLFGPTAPEAESLSTSPQTIIDAIDAAILAMLAGGGAQTLTLEGRSITYTDLGALQKAREFYTGLSSNTTDDQRRMIRTQTRHTR